MTDYKVPGVYVEEPTGLALSVQTGQTAVPVFAFKKADDSGVSAVFGADKAFDSWLDITSAVNKQIGGGNRGRS